MASCVNNHIRGHFASILMNMNICFFTNANILQEPNTSYCLSWFEGGKNALHYLNLNHHLHLFFSHTCRSHSPCYPYLYYYTPTFFAPSINEE
jgi:hypothetical protein